MSMELPVVSANVGGCCEIIDHGVDGFLYEAGNVDDFVSKVVNLLDHEETGRFLADNAKRKIDERYTLVVMLKRYNDFFRTVFLGT